VHLNDPTPAADAATPEQQAPALATPAPLLRWAVIDLTGHQYIAGAVSYELVGDARMVRVDVPAVVRPEANIPAHSKTFGARAIFSIAWCDEAAAQVAANIILHRPPAAEGTQGGSHASA
jgi:hypothetical protein